MTSKVEIRKAGVQGSCMCPTVLNESMHCVDVISKTSKEIRDQLRGHKPMIYLHIEGLSESST